MRVDRGWVGFITASSFTGARAFSQHLGRYWSFLWTLLLSWSRCPRSWRSSLLSSLSQLLSALLSTLPLSTVHLKNSVQNSLGFNAHIIARTDFPHSWGNRIFMALWLMEGEGAFLMALSGGASDLWRKRKDGVRVSRDFEGLFSYFKQWETLFFFSVKNRQTKIPKQTKKKKSNQSPNV